MAGRREKKVDAYRHSSSKRTKVPTEQSEVYMSDDDKAAVSHKQPAREAGSAPTLNWDRGMDIGGFDIQAHPLYIHEKVHPANFVRSLAKWGGGGGSPIKKPCGRSLMGFRRGQPSSGTIIRGIGRIASSAATQAG